MEFGHNDLMALSNMMSEVRDLDRDRGTDPGTMGSRSGGEGGSSTALVTPGSFGAAATPVAQEEEGQEGNKKKKKKDPKDIWDEDEVPPEEAILAEDFTDARPRPHYDIFFKQDVYSQDVFLGLGEKTPSSTDCTHMTVKVRFPGHQMKDLDLDVTKHKLRAESRTHLLSIFLPLPVDHDQGSAKWDAKKDTLIVTLPIIKDEW